MTWAGPPGGTSDFSEITKPAGRFAALAASCGLVLAAGRGLVKGFDQPGAWVVLTASLAMVASALLIAKKRPSGVALIPWAILYGAAGVAFVDGGLFSGGLVWVPLGVTLIPICLRGRSMWVAFMVALSIPVLLAAAGPRPEGALAAQVWFRALGLGASLVFAGGMARTLMRWRGESLQAVRKEHARLQFVLANLPSGIAVTDTNGVVIAANNRLKKLLSLDEEALLGRRFVEVLQSVSGSAAAVEACNGADDSSALDQVVVGDKVYEVRCNSHGARDSKLVLWSFHEVTKRVHSYTAALGQLEEDSLTGLYNRTHLLRQLEVAIHSELNFALLFVDLDGFKLVNDALGHAAGDRILVEVGSRIRSAVRGGDVACRLGGDEFCVITFGVKEAAQVKVVADKLILALASPYENAEDIGASIGIAIYPDAAQSGDALLVQADVAMYAAKRKGGNRWVIAHPSMDMSTVA